MAPILYLNHYRVLTKDDGAPIEFSGTAAGPALRKAEDIQTGNTVALQIVELKEVEPPVREQLLQAAATAKQLQHLNVPTLIDFAVESDQLVCAWQFVEGTTADAWVTAHGPMPSGPALRIAVQVANLLESATFHGLFHPALNPSNILLVPGQTPDGEWPLIKVLNFLDVAPSAADETARRFASPEQLLGARVDFQSEIYSLGCILCYLVTGDVPASGAAFVGDGLPKPLNELIGRMMATNPAQRPQDPVALQEEIRSCLEQGERREAISRRFGVAAVAPVDPVVHTARRPGLLLKPLAIAAGFLLLAGVVAFGLAQARRSNSARSGDPPGVPVGIPEEAAVAAADATQEPPEPPPAVIPAPESVATEAPAVASSGNQPPSAGEPVGELATSETDAGQARSAIASNPPPPPSSPADEPGLPRAEAAPSTEPVIAANSAPPAADPPPPAEAPAAASRATGSDASFTADDPPQVVTAEKSASSQPQRVAKAPKKKQSRTANVEVRRAEPVDDFEADLPPLRRGAKRARFVGTAPDGSLMFELPSQERVYAAPVRGVREHSRKRGKRQVIDDLPVLPAEPVYEEDLR